MYCNTSPSDCTHTHTHAQSSENAIMWHHSADSQNLLYIPAWIWGVWNSPFSFAPTAHGQPAHLVVYVQLITEVTEKCAVLMDSSPCRRACSCMDAGGIRRLFKMTRFTANSDVLLHPLRNAWVCQPRQCLVMVSWRRQDAAVFKKDGRLTICLSASKLSWQVLDF